jgi:hypothetical protein
MCWLCAYRTRQFAEDEAAATRSEATTVLTGERAAERVEPAAASHPTPGQPARRDAPAKAR